ncbi:HAD-IC family P-type ATPase [Companilactobacillus kimchiensis]|uniref:HAD-IC family P-type ATPase n=1 Tax=Companilactobacillus kimchiensis TaxID=993692 RepID=UPI000709053F|nr:HAD-IC family P-type ATPase [Companilactobacillus kimchiensis]
MVENNNLNIKSGLNTDQVNQRIKNKQTNKVKESNSKSTLQIITSNSFTFFNFIFLLLAILLVLVEAYKDLTFLPVIILNTFISIFQELRSKRTLAKLQVLHAEKSSVIRNGTEIQLPTDDLALDDIIHLNAGSQIPADAKLIAGKIRVNEALLTGEADEVTKEIDAELLSGSFVVNGDGFAQLNKVGSESYISQLSSKAKTIGTTEESAMLKSLNKLIRLVGIILIPLGLALFYQSYFMNGNTLKSSIVSMEAALIGMIPEGLYLLTTVALALSAMRLAKKEVLLHSLKSIETLARVSVLCVDKTGTITENKMVVQDVIKAHASSLSEKTQLNLISDFCNNFPGDNSTMKAMKDYFTNESTTNADDIIPFSSAWKFSSAKFNDTTYIFGAPEMVLRDDFEKYQPEFADYPKQGYRVLVFGKYIGASLTEPKLVAPVQPIAFILIRNPVRTSAPKTFKYFDKQNVKIKVISGDDPVTVSSISKEAKIKGAENYIDASKLEPSDYKEALQKYTVFGRVTPDQKQSFVQALQELDETVAMTGDGVNDILAMKEADCSIAMASGNDATMHAAQMVLLDSDFSKMPQIVEEGRQVVNNVERSASLFLVKNIFSLTMTLLTLIFAVNYPLAPSHITLISLYTIGIPSFLLALETNHHQIKGHFLSNIMQQSIPGGITDTVVVATIVFTGKLFNLKQDNISTATVLIMSAVGFLVLYRLSRPLNVFRNIILWGCIVGIIITAIFFGNLFGITKISAIAIGYAAILFLTADSVLNHLTNIVNTIFKKLKLG